VSAWGFDSMEENSQPVIIIGHKNPDSDSVCSAIAYARLKRELYGINAVPYRAGNLNAQTSYILDRFGVDTPEFLPDVYPKISDIMIKGEDLIIISEDDPLKKAQECIIQNHFSFLPVVRRDGKCAGRITAVTLASLINRLPETASGDEAPGGSVSMESILRDAVDRLLGMPVKDFMERDHLTFKPYDLVRNVSREIQKSNEGGFIIVDDEDRIQGVVARINFLKQSRFKVILVDHNELGQSVDGIEEADIVEIIDHHRLGMRTTDQPIQFINKVVGSTSTIIAELFRGSGRAPDPATAGIMLSAVISDTVLLKSPTTTGLDREMAEWLATLAGLDIQEYGEQMLAAGSSLKELGPETVITQDQKTYSESGVRFSISQVEVVGFKQFRELEAVLAEALNTFLKKEALDFSCLMVTDVTHEGSLVLCAGDEKIMEGVTYPRAGENIFEMKGVLSRKKQALPYFIDLIRGVKQ